MDNVKDSNKKWHFVLKIVLTDSEKKLFKESSIKLKCDNSTDCYFVCDSCMPNYYRKQFDVLLLLFLKKPIAMFWFT